MNHELALCSARTWALDFLRSTQGDVEVVVPLPPQVGPVARRFLREAPQECASLRMQWWSGADRGDAIVYTRVREGEEGDEEEEEEAEAEAEAEANEGHDGKKKQKQTFVLRIFEDATCAYAALYHHGARLSDRCLVMWDKRVCDLCNAGYAPGRCPDAISDPDAFTASPEPTREG